MTKRQFAVLESVNCRFAILYTQHNIWERIILDVYALEHCGINVSNYVKTKAFSYAFYMFVSKKPKIRKN